MQIKDVAVDKLIPYAKNSRTHSPEQIGQIAASIKEFGFRQPILVDGLGIIAGHGRLLAAQKLGLSKIPTIDCSDMTESQKKAYIIADNKIALNAGWDNAMLTIELKDLEDEGFDLTLTGFDDKELDALLNVIEGSSAAGNEFSKIHKATFPTYLPENIIQNFCPVKGSILDTFGGTGTTMIAAEKLSRKSYLMELDPKYCDVIVKRWEDFTGKQSVLTEL